MQIKIQIKKTLVLIAILFLFLQAGVIFALSKRTSNAFDYASTQMARGVVSQTKKDPSKSGGQDQGITFADILAPIKEQETEKIQDIQKAEVSEEQLVEQAGNLRDAKSDVKSSYPLHKEITTTFFWVGENAGEDNGGISNSPSAWDEKWVKHFGGEDDPKKRDGYFPAKFTPEENPFYVALPYNDFNEDGDRRSNSDKVIPWAGGKKWKDSESMCKNQWIKIVKGNKVAYAQWEDVGPFEENDSAYVFGSAKPKNKTLSRAGLDVSPAVRDYLGLSDVDKADWQFIDAVDVPDGPWKKIITSSQVYWK